MIANRCNLVLSVVVANDDAGIRAAIIADRFTVNNYTPPHM